MCRQIANPIEVEGVIIAAHSIDIVLNFYTAVRRHGAVLNKTSEIHMECVLLSPYR